MPPSEGERAAVGWRAVKEGFAFLRGRQVLQSTFVIDIIAMVFGMPRALFPVLAVTQFHRGAAVVGLLFAAPAVGAFVGAATSGWVGRIRHQGLAVIWAVVVWGAGIAAFGLVGAHLWLGILCPGDRRGGRRDLGRVPQHDPPGHRPRPPPRPAVRHPHPRGDRRAEARRPGGGPRRGGLLADGVGGLGRAPVHRRRRGRRVASPVVPPVSRGRPGLTKLAPWPHRAPTSSSSGCSTARTCTSRAPRSSSRSRVGAGSRSPRNAWPPRSNGRARPVARVVRVRTNADGRSRALAPALTSRLATASGVRLAVRSRPGPNPTRSSWRSRWRRRGAAEASPRGVAAPARGGRPSLRRAARRRGRRSGRAVEPGEEPRCPTPTSRSSRSPGTNGKTTTVRLLAHIVRSAGRRPSRTRRPTACTAATASWSRRATTRVSPARRRRSSAPDVAVLETARGGILLRGIGVLHNDVAVVTNVSADHLGLHGIDTIDQLAEVKATITRITRPEGWDVLNADDPRVLDDAPGRHGPALALLARPLAPGVRDALAEGGRATVRSTAG